MRFTALLFGAVFAGSAVFAQPESTAQALLDLLVKKGLVTPQEAAQLEQQAQANASAAAAPAAAGTAPTAPLPAAITRTPGGIGVPPDTVDVKPSPLSIRIGGANVTPFGFLDLTGVYRSTLVGSGIGTSFGSIPYANTNGSTIGPVSEFRLSTQNSRLGLRVDSNVGSTKVLGYTEADFLGNAANNVTTVSNADTLRMRVYFVDTQFASGWEFLAGQDWSLLTPNRHGLSPVPSDIFYTQNMDTNYQVGLTWARQAQLRAVYHADTDWTIGVSAENPDQYIGSAVTLPTANLNANQFDISAGSNASGTTNANTMPDFIGKIAYDTKIGDSAFHAELAGLLSEFKVNTYGGNGAINATDSKTGYGAAYNMILTPIPNLNLVETAFVSEGGGRYISTGLGPDFVVSPLQDGQYNVELEFAEAAELGFEYAPVPQDTFFGYWGGAHFGRQEWQTGPTSYLGYGYLTGSNSQNKNIDEFTLGDTYTFWKNPSYGSMQLILQASLVQRQPWYVAPGAPDNAHTGMFFFDVRYTLP
ncbi:MAG TPA: hypothetical protein VFE31_14495 [Opitutaceae bacterium]|nr:hypothetical protein [Opitutaceae bacterium]